MTPKETPQVGKDRGDSGQRAECHGEAVTDVHRDLWELFTRSAAAHPNREAVVSMWQTDLLESATNSSEQSLPQQALPDGQVPGCLRWTYESLLQRSELLAHWLQAQGCGPGMRLVASLWNSAEWALFFWVSVRTGMVFVPVDPRVLATDPAGFLETTSPAVIVVQDADAELSLRESAVPATEKAAVRICCAETATPRWTSLSAIPDGSAAAASAAAAAAPERPPSRINGIAQHSAKPSVSAADRTALIIFTSGTTSTPKGCLHTVGNLWSQTHDFDPNPPGHHDRWLVHTPVAHVFAVNNALRAWRNGDTVVFPSKTFDVQSTMRALTEEKCTVMSAIPALVKALLAQPNFPSHDALNLRYVTLGSTIITDADIRLCRERLGSQWAIQAFGMSEGVPMVSWLRKDPLLKDGYHPGVGKALPGASIRICAPESRKPLRRNEIGELHMGGPSVIRGYLHGLHKDSFYSDESGHWLATGDQARIDDDGVLHIIGRYKDIIIRAGENIPPIKIEVALAQIPGVVAQVIGVEDEIAGQTPAAVVMKLPEGCTKRMIAEKAKALGPIYALDAVYTLAELGLESFPLTITGKVRKDILKKAVSDHRRKGTPSTAAPDTAFSDTLDKLCSIWEDLVGVRPEPGSSIGDFADSITLLRFCDRVLRNMGHRIYLQDMMDHDTAEKQAKLLLSRSQPQAPTLALPTRAPSSLAASLSIANGHGPVAATTGYTTEPSGAFTTASPPAPFAFSAASAPLTTEIHQAPGFQAATSSALREYGIQSTEVEDVLSIEDYLCQLVSGPRPQSYRHRMGFALGVQDIRRVRQAVETGLASRPTLRTLLARLPSGMPFHVVIKPCDALFDSIISTHEVSDEAALRDFLADDTAALFPASVMTQAHIIRLNTTGEVSLSMTYSHSVFDMLSVGPFHVDLDRLLAAADPSAVPIPPLTPFRLFADLARLYRDSVPATAAVASRVSRLRGISRFRAALWPPRRAPGPCMVASDADTPLAAERAAVRRAVWAAAGEDWDDDAATRRAFRFPRESRIVGLPGLAQLPQDTDPQTLARAALAVFNALRTGQAFALFSTVEAGRRWPFVPAWMAGLLPPAMSVDGPTCEWVLNMFGVDVGGAETVGQLIGRMAGEQAAVEEHAHAPWFRVLEALGPEEAAVVVEASQRQTFVWDVSLRFASATGDYQVMKPVARYDWADCGLYWNCCMVDKTHLFVVASWDTAQMSSTEVEGHCDGFADVLRRMAQPENWDKPLNEVFG